MKTRLNIWSLLLLLTLPDWVPATSGTAIPAGAGRGSWRNFHAADGNNAGPISSVIQDREGYIWFTTYGGGVTRYDGQDFVTFTTADGLAHNQVRPVFQDREGHIWFGTIGGVSRLDGRTAGGDSVSFETFTTEDGLVHNFVSSIFQDREGHFWFGTGDLYFSGGGLSYYDGDIFVNFTTADGLPDPDILSIAQDHQGRMWFATGAGLSRYDGRAVAERTPQVSESLKNSAPSSRDSASSPRDLASSSRDSASSPRDSTSSSRDSAPSPRDSTTFTTFTTRDGLPDDRVNAVWASGDGTLWIGTFGGVSRCDTWTEDGDPVSFANFTTRDGLVNDNVHTIFQDDKGFMWFGTEGGVSRYDGRTFTNFTTEEGLIFNAVESIIQDREGHFWFGTQDGLSWYGGRTITTFTARDGLVENSVRAIVQDREGNMWFGTRGGVSRYDGNTFTNFTTRDGLGSDHIASLIQDRAGHIWAGTFDGGASHFDGRNWTTLDTTDGLAHQTVYGMYEDGEDNLWFATWGGGVSRYDGQNWTTFDTRDGLIHDHVNSVVQDGDGNMWFATLGGGITRYDARTAADRATQVRESLRDSATSRRDSAFFKSFTTADGLLDGYVWPSFLDSKNRLWFGTAGGVSRFDGGTFTNFTTRDGLLPLPVRSFLQDGDDVWIALDSGVSRYDGRDFQSLKRQDGLGGDMVYTAAQDRDGALWFGTAGGGVTRFIQPRPFPPSVRIDAVVADRRYAGLSELSIPSSAGLVAFEFRGRSFKTRPGGMVYKYRLRGRDEAWQRTTTHRVEYADLPAGDYIFEIRALDRDLVYSEQTATLALTVHLPYERIGLISALGLAVALIAWQTTRLIRRGRQLQNSNDALSGANRELFGLNQDLEQKTDDLDKARLDAESANHAKSLFLANMSHEIRTPMNAILGYAQILQRSADLDHRHRHAVETIHRSGDHLLNLINDVLDISKIEAGRMELSPDNFDLGDLLQGLSVMFELQCREKGLAWRLEGVGPEKLLLYGDEAKLRQILINLIGNAMKFTDEGEVLLRLVAQPENRYRFEVIDTGPGMNPEEVRAIFAPFQQGEAGLRQGGTGLGLTISQRQLELMHGQLEVESAPGEGSRFAFAIELPPARGAVHQERIDDWTRVSGLATDRHIEALVADDVAENREILSSVLEEIGIEVTTVENGRQALEHMRVSRPDIVFLDIRMPVLDGIETMELLQQNDAWKDIKVIAISASVLDHERQAFLTSGFDDFIDKPLRVERIYACLAQHLGAEYEYSEAADEKSPSASAWTGISLPQELLTGLKKAAEFYSVTQIEGYLREMEQLGETPRQLAAHLSDLRQRHDMEAILAVLENVDHE